MVNCELVFIEWPDYESESDTSQVDTTNNQSSQAITPTDDVSMDTTTSMANQHRDTSTPLVDLSKDFVEGGER